MTSTAPAGGDGGVGSLPVPGAGAGVEPPEVSGAAAAGPPIGPPQTPVLSVSCRMLRSPSHESVTTDLSLLSVSSMSLANDMRGLRLVGFNKRGVSPNPDSISQVSITRPPDIPELLWFEEENELIRSCAALSSALGLQRSFSTSDIAQLPENQGANGGEGGLHVGSVLTLGTYGALTINQAGPEGDSPPTSMRPSVSEPALNSLQRLGFIMEQHQLNRTSRSCSTWVAVGDVVSTSQLPSPHGGHSLVGPSGALGQGPPPAPAPTPATPSFTPADLIRSVNKKVRQNYIRRRLLMTYKALERLSQSEFNLDRLEAAASASSAAASSPIPSMGPGSSAPGSSRGGSVSGSLAQPAPPSAPSGPAPSLLTVPGGPPPARLSGTLSPTSTVMRVVKHRDPGHAAHGVHPGARAFPLTVRDVERSQGRPLSRYDRNMMIFNWLHTLDDTDFEKLEVSS
ncbi:transcription initiation factor TFIID subunit 4-like [Frankliniella occidentalis]|uniref:Transcription initiation factor TFIID subunit 4-like n=1 Tax=Frankliniella occidentalis TaxID=133901 RepID=A0A9C6X7T2_FRAOC|nr:transcription initiation factor TFIID subunit 4-like [Frankliniella occidentalis]